MKALLICLILGSLSATAQQLGVHERKGLDDTKEFLKSSQERDKFIKSDKNAKEVDTKVESLAGSKKNKEEIYGISAEVMEKLTTATNGDPDKMKAILEEAQKNPQGFYEKFFDDAAKARVRGVANDIEKNQRPIIDPTK